MRSDDNGDSVAVRKGAGPLVQSIILASLWVSVQVAPRVTVGEIGDARPINIRIEDPVLLPLLAILLFTNFERLSAILKTEVFKWLAGVLLVMSAASVSGVLAGTSQPLSAVAHLYRLSSGLLLAIVVGLITWSLGKRASRIALTSVVVCGFLNLAWLGFQEIQGFSMTAWERLTGAIGSPYGPSLLGEKAAMPTGAYLLFLVTVVLASWRARLLSGHWTSAAYFVAILCSLLVESRASMVGVITVGFLSFLSNRNLSRKARSTLGLLCLTFVGALFMLLYQGYSFRRFNWGVWSSFLDVRVSTWSSWLDLISQYPILGWGPGNHSIGYVGWEVHNLFLRLALDFGAIGILTFTCLFFVVIRQPSTMSRPTGDGDIVMLWQHAATYMVCGLAVMGLVQDSIYSSLPWFLLMLLVGTLLGFRARQLQTPSLAGSASV